MKYVLQNRRAEKTMADVGDVCVFAASVVIAIALFFIY